MPLSTSSFHEIYDQFSHLEKYRPLSAVNGINLEWSHIQHEGMGIAIPFTLGPGASFVKFASNIQGLRGSLRLL